MAFIQNKIDNTSLEIDDLNQFFISNQHDLETVKNKDVKFYWIMKIEQLRHKV